MAIRRTREQKQRAIERRAQEYAYVSELQEKSSGAKSEADASVVLKKSPPLSVFDSGLTKHRQRTAAYLAHDIRRILITTLLLAIVLVGIWYGTRYNDVLLF